MTRRPPITLGSIWIDRHQGMGNRRIQVILTDDHGKGRVYYIDLARGQEMRHTLNRKRFHYLFKKESET